jgi:Co/Zn/Cd efflux system component
MAHHSPDRPSHTHEHASHSHLHGIIDPAIATTARGMWAIKWSCVGLLVTACVQLLVVALSGSVALLADTMHNFGDAATAFPLWVAFLLARRRPSERFTYGLGRFEDLAGLVIVLIMALTTILVGEVRHQLLHHMRYLNEAIIHIDPLDKAGAEHHRIAEHIHDGLPAHSHS